MARIRETWQGVIERTAAFGNRAWRDLPRARWSMPGVALMAALLALSIALVWHCQGNAWVFCAGIVVAGQLIGAACGVPFRRMIAGGLCGAVLGLLFFAYAAMT